MKYIVFAKVIWTGLAVIIFFELGNMYFISTKD